MTITTVDELETGLSTRNTKIASNRSDTSGGNANTGQFLSYWQAGGTPGAGATPTTSAAVNHLTTGALPFMQQTSPLTSYLAELGGGNNISDATIELHDRLIHMGGLNGNIITLQAVTGLDLSTFLSSDNITNRIGDANYSDVQWWVEFYNAIGATTSVATIGVTYNDGTTGNLTTISAFGRRAARMLPLNYLIPDADSGKYIRGIREITLSVATGTVGNFGFTATRYRSSVYVPTINKQISEGWTKTGLTEIYNNSCLFPIIISPGQDSGDIRINGKIVHG